MKITGITFKAGQRLDPTKKGRKEVTVVVSLGNTVELQEGSPSSKVVEIVETKNLAYDILFDDGSVWRVFNVLNVFMIPEENKND